ncbi:MAG: hypothetical protein CMO01_29445 [Thalassobius sp.]|nr:hypothetical protein [Thalassovita sp.]
MVDNKKLSVKFYLRDNLKELKKTDKKRVYCRIGYDRKASEISLDFWYSMKEWSKKKELPKYDDAGIEFFSNLRSEIYQIRADLFNEKRKVSARRIKMILSGEELSGKKVKRITISEALELYKEYTNENIQIALSTRKSIKVKIRRWEEFLKSKGNQEILLSEVDKVFLFDMDLYYVNSVSKQFKKPLKRNYINHLHKFFKTFLNWCILKNYIKENPYKFFKLKKDDSKATIKYLTQDELIKMHSHQLHGNIRLTKIKDMFLFCCYTGLRFSDVTALKLSDITLVNENLAIKKEQVKTGKRVYIPLLEPAKEIYHKYKDDDGAKITGLLFPGITNQKANIYLKEIATICNIDKTLNFHMSRHTCGTYLISNGMSLEEVAEILGHTDIKTTRIYAKITGKSINKSMEAINKKLVKHLEGVCQTIPSKSN